MALVNCHECKKEISTDAKACPNCGAKIRKIKSRRAWKILLLGAIIVIAAFNLSPIKTSDPCNNEITQAKAHGTARRAIEARLRAPSTADFSSLSESTIIRTTGSPPGECQFSVRLWVDAQNAFGAKLRNHYEVHIKGASAGAWTAIGITQKK